MRKTALITGATSGIGLEFAKAYADRGYRLILCGRREERLLEFAMQVDVPVRVLCYDLSMEENCYKLLSQLEDEKIDIFINNAGFGTCGIFTETDLAKEIAMIHVNDIAMHILFKGILKQMKGSGKGKILNVASSAGLMPGGPYMATYYATKAYVTSLTRAVARELKEEGSRIYVGALCPGPVDTEFNDCADVKFALKGISAEDCVRSALLGMKRRKVIIVPSLTMKLAMFGQKFVPDWLMVIIAGRQQSKKMGA